MNRQATCKQSSIVLLNHLVNIPKSLDFLMQFGLNQRFVQFILELVKIFRNKNDRLQLQANYGMNSERTNLNELALTVVLGPPNDLLFQVIDNQLIWKDQIWNKTGSIMRSITLKKHLQVQRNTDPPKAPYPSHPSIVIHHFGIQHSISYSAPNKENYKS